MKICETAARLRRDPLFEVHCGIKGKEPRSQHKEYQMGLLAFDFALAFAVLIVGYLLCACPLLTAAMLHTVIRYVLYCHRLCTTRLVWAVRY